MAYARSTAVFATRKLVVPTLLARWFVRLVPVLPELTGNDLLAIDVDPEVGAVVVQECGGEGAEEECLRHVDADWRHAQI